MSTNYLFKNMKLLLDGEEQTLYHYDDSKSEVENLIILSGQITNISNEDTTLKYLKVNNPPTEDSHIYYNINIPANASLPITRIYLKTEDQLIIRSDIPNNLVVVLIKLVFMLILNLKNY